MIESIEKPIEKKVGNRLARRGMRLSGVEAGPRRARG
jgi:hypothetical protein